jgi:hypothetical protein
LKRTIIRALAYGNPDDSFRSGLPE